ncbi:hypothetical protein HU200_056030 [Digitaria exilis]|uniref:Uncharacterized protein n=1 Tax=Digitaria exilis TaxID=1010633 RepID=A0A835AHD7_9POAL|nr:hypothetical protein HU200_056030 [Digitaria exilis]
MAMATGFIVMLFAASVGLTFGGVIGSLLSFAGVLAGANLVTAGILVADDPAAGVGPAAFDGARALAAFLRPYLAVAGLVMASSAVTTVSGEAGPALCIGMLAMLLLGLALINIGVRAK